MNTPRTVQLQTWIGLNNDQKRDIVISDFMSDPEGLAHLVTKDADGINSRSHNDEKRVIARESFTTTRIQVKMLKYLMYWVQDLHIYQENYDFLDVINQQQFLYGVGEYLHQHGTRKKCCKYRH